MLCVKIFSKHICLLNVTVKTRGEHFHSFPPGGAPPNRKKQEKLKIFDCLNSPKENICFCQNPGNKHYFSLGNKHIGS